MSRHGRRVVLAAGAAVGALASHGVASLLPPGFYPLPLRAPQAYSALVFGVSGDGRVAVGYAAATSTSSQTDAVGWRDGVVEVYTAPGVSNGQGRGANRDGSVIAGKGELSSGQRYPIAIRNGQISLLADWTVASFALAASADGSVIVGRGQTLPFRYDSSGYHTLTPFFYSKGYATGISDNGDIIVGNSTQDDGTTNPGQATKWVNNTASGLPFLPVYTRRSEANDISPDGGSIVGMSMHSSGYQQACLWNAAGVTALGFLPQDNVSRASAVSQNGQFVVGISGVADNTVGNISQSQGFIWTPADGMMDLRAWALAKINVDLSGWRLSLVTGISDDGTVIVGQGRDPFGIDRPWLLRIPSPGTAGLLMMGGVCSLRRRR